jgi:hypothetical protein
MHETDRFDIAERVAVSKARLSEKLSELARRMETAREKVQRPAELARKPWVLAAAGVAGFLVGLRLRRSHRASGAVGRHPSIARAVLREILITAAGTATRRYLGTGRAPY